MPTPEKDGPPAGPILRYWRRYGGWKAVLKSSYFRGSILVTAACYPFWSVPTWWDTVISVAPSMLGFSLGGFAMLLAFGGDQFLKLIAKKREVSTGATSLYVDTSSGFVHFIFVQTIALVAAIICKAWFVPVPGWAAQLLSHIGITPDGFCRASQLVVWGIGFLVFIYSIACALAAAFRIFVLTELFEKFSNLPAKDEDATPKPSQSLQNIEAKLNEIADRLRR